MISFENSVYITKLEIRVHFYQAKGGAKFSVVPEKWRRTPGSIYHVSDIRRKLEETPTHNFKRGQEKLSTVSRVWTSGEGTQTKKKK